MDNEASKALKQALLKNKINYQLVPPHINQQNAAERAIQSFKSYFIAGLCFKHPDFPANEWDRLLPQAELTLNLLRKSRINPKLSAYATIHGVFDFNRTPLLPPGSKVLIHDKPGKRASWDTHGTDAWYIGPSLEHYRCVNCYVPSTNSVRTADTLAFFPYKIPIPSTTSIDCIKKSLSDIISILNSPFKTLPSLHFGDDTKNAIQQIATILKRSF